MDQHRRGLDDAAQRVGDRWSLLLVEALLDGPRRFSDLQAAVPGLAPNILTRRLKHLEGVGVVLAVPYSQRPPRYAYRLTATGADLAGALRLLTAWGAQDQSAAPRHDRCGTPLEPRWYCPTCDALAGEPDLDETTWL